jgi:hypothetical protein
MIINGNDHYLDFLLINKSLFYLMVLCFFVNKKIFDKNTVSLFLRILLSFFLLKYLVWRILLISDRPGIFGENNFELVFLLLVFICDSYYEAKLKILESIAILAVFALSGSRSGIVCLVLVFGLLSLRRLDTRLLISFVLIFCVSYFALDIFMSRMTERGFEAVDRFVFTMNFINDVSNWSLFNYLFGTYPITPMSAETCSNLYFYQNLFSFHDKYVCYSSILHSYVLRTIYDHGLVVLLLIVAFLNWALKFSIRKINYRYAIIGVILLSGLSVSSLNNIFVALGLLLSLSIKEDIK